MRWRESHILVDDGVMRVRLVRKLADVLDGIDVSAHSSGDILELSRRDAELLIAERWAVRATRGDAISGSSDTDERTQSEHSRAINCERVGTQRDDRDR
jgi:hypothetical protein